MDAGIGAPGAAYPDPFTAQGFERCLDHLLHGEPIRLPLPADKGRAVIFERQLIAGHRLLGQAGTPRQAARRAKNPPASIGALPERCTSRRRSAPCPQANRQLRVENTARRASFLRDLRAQDLDAFHALAKLRFEKRAGSWRESPDEIVQIRSRPLPIDPRFGLVDFMRVGNAFRRLGRKVEPALIQHRQGLRDQSGARVGKTFERGRRHSYQRQSRCVR